MNKSLFKSILFCGLLCTGISCVRAAEECCEPASREEQPRSSVLSACWQMEHNGSEQDKAIATELRQAIARRVNFDAIPFITEELDRVLIQCWPSDRVEGILVALKHELLGLNPDGSVRAAELDEKSGPEASEVGATDLDNMLGAVNGAFKVYLFDKLNEVEATGKPQDKRIADSLRAKVVRIRDLQVDDFFNTLEPSIGSCWDTQQPSDEAKGILLELWHLWLNIKV